MSAGHGAAVVAGARRVSYVPGPRYAGVLSLDLDRFMLELKQGTLKHVGPPSNAATVKLYDVERTEARAFGDRRVKLVCEDDGDNVIEIAVDPEQAEELAEQLAAVDPGSE